MMEILQHYEAIFGQPRDEWTKPQWKDVAEQLATKIDAKPQPKKLGRRQLNRYEKDNIPALAFWADQEKEDARQVGKKISELEAIRRVMLKTASSSGLRTEHVKQKLASAVKQVRTFRQELKKRNSIQR